MIGVVCAVMPGAIRASTRPAGTHPRPSLNIIHYVTPRHCYLSAAVRSPPRPRWGRLNRCATPGQSRGRPLKRQPFTALWSGSAPSVFPPYPPLGDCLMSHIPAEGGGLLAACWPLAPALAPPQVYTNTVRAVISPPVLAVGAICTFTVPSPPGPPRGVGRRGESSRLRGLFMHRCIRRPAPSVSASFRRPPDVISASLPDRHRRICMGGRGGLL